jgi:hypothetical protein
MKEVHRRRIGNRGEGGGGEEETDYVGQGGEEEND